MSKGTWERANQPGDGEHSSSLDGQSNIMISLQAQHQGLWLAATNLYFLVLLGWIESDEQSLGWELSTDLAEKMSVIS